MIAKFPKSAFALLSLVAVGCGGSGSDANQGGGTQAGIYRSDYNRGGGSLTLSVDGQGKAALLMTDSGQGLFYGSGSATGGHFSMVCHGTENRIVNVSGNISGSGTGAHANGQVSGNFAASFVANYAGAPAPNLFEHQYVGSFTGTQNGVIVGAVGANGGFNGTLSFGQEATVLLSGTVSANGQLMATGTSGLASFTLKGMLDASDSTMVTGGGLWSSPSKGAGSFTLSQSQ